MPVLLWQQVVQHRQSRRGQRHRLLSTPAWRRCTHPHNPASPRPRFLAPDYRRPLVLRDILGFNADIVCLQVREPGFSWWQLLVWLRCGAGSRTHGLPTSGWCVW